MYGRSMFGLIVLHLLWRHHSISLLVFSSYLSDFDTFCGLHRYCIIVSEAGLHTVETGFPLEQANRHGRHPFHVISHDRAVKLFGWLVFVAVTP